MRQPTDQYSLGKFLAVVGLTIWFMAVVYVTYVVSP